MIEARFWDKLYQMFIGPYAGLVRIQSFMHSPWGLQRRQRPLQRESFTNRVDIGTSEAFSIATAGRLLECFDEGWLSPRLASCSRASSCRTSGSNSSQLQLAHRKSRPRWDPIRADDFSSSAWLTPLRSIGSEQTPMAGHPCFAQSYR